MRKKLSNTLVFQIPGVAPEPPPIIIEHDLFKFHRKKMPETRLAMNHKFTIGDHEFFMIVGLFDDGKPGEIFVKTLRSGSTISGLLNTIAAMTSISLQCGVPLEMLVKKFSGDAFEPSGHTTHPQIEFATSITDYIFRWLAFTFIKDYVETETKGRGSSSNT